MKKSIPAQLRWAVHLRWAIHLRWTVQLCWTVQLRWTALLAVLFLFVVNSPLYTQVQADQDAAPREIIVILDVSGSMNLQNRFVNVLDYLDNEVVGSLLRNGDTFSLVTFGERVVERFSRTVASDAQRAALRTELRQLWANEDRTDIGAALEKVGEIMERQDRAGTRQIILFITDGINIPPENSRYYGVNISIDERLRNIGERISRGAWFFYIIGIGGVTAAQDIAGIVPGSEIITTDSTLEGVEFSERVSQEEEVERVQAEAERRRLEEEQARLEEERRLEAERNAGLMGVLRRFAARLGDLAASLGIPLPVLIAALILIPLLIILLIVFVARAFKTKELLITDGKETLIRKIPPGGNILLNSSAAVLPGIGNENNQVFRIQRGLFGLSIQILDSAAIAEKSPYKKAGTHSLKGVINLANGAQVRVSVR